MFFEVVAVGVVASVNVSAAVVAVVVAVTGVSTTVIIAVGCIASPSLLFSWVLHSESSCLSV